MVLEGLHPAKSGLCTQLLNERFGLFEVLMNKVKNNNIAHKHNHTG